MPIRGAEKKERYIMVDKNKNIGNEVKGKGLELKRWFSDMNAKIEEWKFSVENTKDGLRVELHTVAFIKHPSSEKK
jgi:hypothetical protein